MENNDSQPDTDAYYGSEEINDGDIDLSFLDEADK